MLVEAGTPLGVLLLSGSGRSDSLELVYLGLAPPGRGRGLAELLMQTALSQVVQRGLDRLCLAVDAANVPALKLYYRHGMHRMATRVAMLRDIQSE